MRITEKRVREFAEGMGDLLGIDLEVNPRNGYYGLDYDNGKRNIFCGSLRECYAFLKGINEGIYLYSKNK